MNCGQQRIRVGLEPGMRGLPLRRPHNVAKTRVCRLRFPLTDRYHAALHHSGGVTRAYQGDTSSVFSDSAAAVRFTSTRDPPTPDPGAGGALDWGRSISGAASYAARSRADRWAIPPPIRYSVPTRSCCPPKWKGRMRCGPYSAFCEASNVIRRVTAGEPGLALLGMTADVRRSARPVDDSEAPATEDPYAHSV
jgi:hypothetical protein